MTDYSKKMNSAQAQNLEKQEPLIENLKKQQYTTEEVNDIYSYDEEWKKKGKNKNGKNRKNTNILDTEEMLQEWLKTKLEKDKNFTLSNYIWWFAEHREEHHNKTKVIL